MLVRAIEEHGVEETLDAIDRCYLVRTEADSVMFELAARFADLQPGEGLPQRESDPVLRGMERSVQVGGAGTPRIAEFMVAELGGRMRVGSWSARAFVADALDVRHRLPLIWARVRAREARIGNVRLVASRTRHLSVAAAGHVDAAMVEFVDGSLPWGRFEARLMGKIVAADPEAAAALEAEQVGRQLAKRTRSSQEGTAGFYVRSTVGVIARLDATVGFVAEALAAFGDRDGLDQRRVKAVLVLANPTRAVELLAAYAALRARSTDVELPLDTSDDEPEQPEQPDEPGPGDPLDRMDEFARRVGFTPTRLPTWLAARTGTGSSGDGGAPSFAFDWSALLPPLTLSLHLSVEDLVGGRGGVVRWPGEGPVTHAFVHEHLRPLHSYVLQPVLDLAGMAPVDAYEIPDRHRRAVVLRTPADTAPYSPTLVEPEHRVDLDHTLEYDAALATHPPRHWSTQPRNLAPLGRFAHRVKTHGRWTLRQPFEGIMLWRDPHGQIYLVDHTGTHKVTQPATPAGPARAYDPDLELFPAPGLVIELDPVA